uniref:NADP-dependent oxidoreductase domain-containing protein n=1 Tax=Chenopodium quinoa TaxID=63459 RepID=A0A803MWU0_CHEQI
MVIGTPAHRHTHRSTIALLHRCATTALTRTPTACSAALLILQWLSAFIMRAYSPLAMGILFGKYFGDDRGPADARLNLFKGRYSEGESRYSLSNAATKLAYSFQLWKDFFYLKHPLVASAVLGATKIWQLQEIVNAFRIELSAEVVAKINKVHSRFPNPCP